MEKLASDRVVGRIWAKDASLWKGLPAHRLGWLTSCGLMEKKTAELASFADDVFKAGFRHAAVLGMGGSSLCPDVLRKVFAPRGNGLKLHVIDSTVPAAIRLAESELDPEKTFFLVSSKSGTTAESLALFRHFYSRAENGGQFAAITDPGTPLEDLARKNRFRKVFLNPPDIGGRFSALSYFGLVPAALLGIDLRKWIGRAENRVRACTVETPLENNPGAALGARLAEGYEKGKDKLTLRLTPTFEPLGDWIEQLVAESTGKDGKGILPVVSEPAGDSGVFGDDRLVVDLRNTFSDPYDLAGEFFRWEFAVAVAGYLLGVNPFDEPDVRKAKEYTDLFLSAPAPRPESPGAEEARAFFSGSKPGEFVALLAYLPQTPEIEAALSALRRTLRDRFRIAVTTGFGPRYLHSTGQYHKGGANNGRFVLFTSDNEDLPIPGETYGFRQLAEAQAAGDLKALQDRGRKTIAFHFGKNPAAELEKLRTSLI